MIPDLKGVSDLFLYIFLLQEIHGNGFNLCGFQDKVLSVILVGLMK